MWMSGVQEAITSRRTIYRYSSEEVDSRILEMGFEAARNAPCHKNTHPWKFYVMGKDSRNTLIPEIKSLAVKKYAGEGDSGEMVTRAINKILSPPILICVTTALVCMGHTYYTMYRFHMHVWARVTWARCD